MSMAERRSLEQFSCRCHNIHIEAFELKALDEAHQDFQGAFVGDNGIHISHHCLTLRTRDKAEPVDNSSKNLIQHLSLSCLACKTHVYRIAQEVTPGTEAREGPILPSEDWYEEQTLCSKNGWIEIFRGPGGCIVGSQNIKEQLRSLEFSDTFGIAIVSPAPPASDPSIPSALDTAQSWADSYSESNAESVAPPSLQILPNLPPLFPPPPFTPSHPVFAVLSARATDRSTDLRRKAEEDARAFVKSLIDSIQKEEAQLRKEVEGVWRGYREGYKELMERVNEERRVSLLKAQISSPSLSSSRSGVPMSIHDFSPIIGSGIDEERETSPSMSLLSASMTDDAVASSAYLRRSSNTRSSISNSYIGSSRSLGATASISPGLRGDVVSSAFKRNMDTNVDVASSVKWAQGEEEMRKRFGGGDRDRQDRARKRTSKNLGIVADEVKQATSTNTDEAQDLSKADPISKTPTAADLGTTSKPEQTTPEVNGNSKGKRRVTFDVNSEIAKTHDRSGRKAPQESGDAMVELFDIDDFSAIETAEPHTVPRVSVTHQPVVRTPPYKLRRNGRQSSDDFSLAASLPVSNAISTPQGHDIARSWFGGSSLRSTSGFTQAFPLLSSSVPDKHRIVRPSREQHAGTSSHQQTAESEPVDNTTSPQQAEEATKISILEPDEPEIDEGATEAIKTLLAGSAPSHRHAWKEGGKAWDMFRKRPSRKPRRAIGMIAEEETEDPLNISDDDDESDESSETSPTNDTWQNPSRFASSLPVQIRPLLNYKPDLEPKTSLTDKQGVLVPPLKSKPRSSSSAIRKAVYAERDRSRAIDPGPTLEFNDLEETEDEEIGSENEEIDRGRRHALSILQARSVVPEAGMWRSMAS
ncbi:hypothetical protein M422DRAFT_22755 [Sphaerobolus stellatus SS14]|nr:hypothetical protein M422DRAFT_22755 [Sphaerobolus stellatus SS14]